MNLATQFAALVSVVERAEAQRTLAGAAEQLKHQRQRAKTLKAYAPKKALERAEYQTTILDGLRGSDPLNSATLGRLMGCGRLTAYKRLCVLENVGLVIRVGEGVKTKWSVPPCPDSLST